MAKSGKSKDAAEDDAAEQTDAAYFAEQERALLKRATAPARELAEEPANDLFRHYEDVRGRHIIGTPKPEDMDPVDKVDQFQDIAYREWVGAHLGKDGATLTNADLDEYDRIAGPDAHFEATFRFPMSALTPLEEMQARAAYRNAGVDGGLTFPNSFGRFADPKNWPTTPGTEAPGQGQGNNQGSESTPGSFTPSDDPTDGDTTSIGDPPDEPGGQSAGSSSAGAPGEGGGDGGGGDGGSSPAEPGGGAPPPPDAGTAEPPPASSSTDPPASATDPPPSSEPTDPPASSEPADPPASSEPTDPPASSEPSDYDYHYYGPVEPSGQYGDYYKTEDGWVNENGDPVTDPATVGSLEHEYKEWEDASSDPENTDPSTEMEGDPSGDDDFGGPPTEDELAFKNSLDSFFRRGQGGGDGVTDPVPTDDEAGVPVTAAPEARMQMHDMVGQPGDQDDAGGSLSDAGAWNTDAGAVDYGPDGEAPDGPRRDDNRRESQHDMKAQGPDGTTTEDATGNGAEPLVDMTRAHVVGADISDRLAFGTGDAGPDSDGNEPLTANDAAHLVEPEVPHDLTLGADADVDQGTESTETSSEIAGPVETPIDEIPDDILQADPG